MNSKYIVLADGRSPHVLKWIKELVKYFDIYLITLNGVDSNVFDLIAEEKVYVLNDNVNSEGGNYKLILKVPEIRRIVRFIQPKYINAHYLSSYGFLAALSKNTMNDVILIQSTWGSDILLEPFSNMVRKQIAQFSLKKADYITSDSWHMTDVIKQLVKKKEIISFPFGLNAVDADSNDKENIIFSNRALKKLYNIDKILEWFAKQNQSYVLVIAYGGLEEGALKMLAKKIGVFDRVKFVGFLSASEQEKYYKKTRYYISIPESDSTSVSLLEAMKYGAIPIVSNIPVNREWILDGVNGVFFDSKLKIEDIRVESNFSKINNNILKQRAFFSKCIENDFIKKIQ